MQKIWYNLTMLNASDLYSKQSSWYFSEYSIRAAMVLFYLSLRGGKSAMAPKISNERRQWRSNQDKDNAQEPINTAVRALRFLGRTPGQKSGATVDTSGATTLLERTPSGGYQLFFLGPPLPSFNRIAHFRQRM